MGVPKGLFAYDGRLSRVLLAVFQCFAVSALFLLTALPAIVLDQASGRASHAAIWLGVVAALPIGPGVYAVLAGTRDFIAEGGYAGAVFGRFWRAFATGAVRLRRLWAGTAVIELLLAYNAALYGSGDGAFLAITAGGALVAAAVIAVCCVALQGVTAERPLELLTVALHAAAARPLAPLAWLAVLAAALAATQLPVFGPNLALFLPAAAAWAVLTANRRLGFDRKAAELGR
ncbi:MULTISPECIES: hypothetical protein [Glycomyces]|uniref:DUF624 domain-containing protein n=2 Tax=Glycomyces TaxID=58113 RepID=A0A9X3PF80_9ACTN|nr:hypothetical protein [Glycomyces lechevalierae]MDA1383877.1 hypothetical protein [Glycomyces lechevalierae]MDR7341131.1 hypothetical protein [Glycomyces lechevalierae]